MKFVVVNHRTPLRQSTCLHCSQPLGAGYLRDVATQRPYCDYDCYRHSEASRFFMPWLAAPRAPAHAAAHHPLSLGWMASLAAAACWSYAIPFSAVSLSLFQAALGMHELMATEGVQVRRPG